MVVNETAVPFSVWEALLSIEDDCDKQKVEPADTRVQAFLETSFA